MLTNVRRQAKFVGKKSLLQLEMPVVHMPLSIRHHWEATLARGTWLTIFGSELVALLNPLREFGANNAYGQHRAT